VPQRPPADILNDLPSAEPMSRRERRRAVTYLTLAVLLVTLVVLAVVFDQFAATGVLLIVFLSFVLAYLIGPAAERLRYAAAPSRRGRPLQRGISVLVIYGVVAVVTFPLWTLAGQRLGPALERMTVLVPEHTARFIEQLHENERWHDGLGLPIALNAPIGAMTRRVTGSLEAEARALGAELAGIRRLVPWLSTVPVVAFLLLTRWHRFRRSTTRALPTPHLQWRGNEFLLNLNRILATYTRAQIISACLIGTICWIGFAALGLPYPGTLGIAAGALEMVPLAGPLIVAVVATAMAPDRVVAVLVFLAGLRLVQDYAIYPRLISRVMHLHPVAVVLALWVGAALGGVVGVCLAVPIVGIAQVAHRHWREYREIETLIRERAAT
jgi:predicted PurR-regulated permease PerM